MSDLGLFSKTTLAEVAAYWQKISFESVDPATLQSDSGTNVSWGQLRDCNLRMLQPGGINFMTGDLAALKRWWIDGFSLYTHSILEHVVQSQISPHPTRLAENRIHDQTACADSWATASFTILAYVLSLG